AGTVTRADGSYDLPAMPPGQYRLRVTLLDPSVANNVSFRIRGRDIAPAYDSAGTSFLPSTTSPVTLTAGATVTQNFSVTSGDPAFRITHIRAPSAIAESFSWSPFPVSLRPGQSNYSIGVASTNLPTSGATLIITGDGLTLGEATFTTFSGLNFISVPISVGTNATPGLRSLVVQLGNNVAYANGFLEIQPPVPDFNFDGLDDRFQRQYFPLFTAPEAGPNADPDGDGFNNE